MPRHTIPSDKSKGSKQLVNSKIAAVDLEPITLVFFLFPLCTGGEESNMTKVKR